MNDDDPLALAAPADATRALRRLAVGALGLALGGIFLWLALRDLDLDTMRAALRTLDPLLVALSLALYWLGLALRVERWQSLLAQLQPVTRREVAEVLLVGYAVNNLLPARLGELFRADYAKRRSGLSRAKVLGSIVIERAADLAAILACLACGLLATGVLARAEALMPGRMLFVGAMLCAGAAGGLWLARRGGLGLPRLPWTLLRLTADLGSGLRALNRATLARTCALTIAVWSAEVTALWTMLAALGERLQPAQALFVMSAASLSTLVPTAPGYLGTYQLAFATAMTAFGLSATHGVLASTLIQLLLFGSVTMAGLLLYLARWMHNMRPVRNEALLGGSDFHSR
ncbi:MAG: lysylphosphatidylglycerol synthase transmembrane domain-containing protein [Gammaproteobacteria bacterium]